MYLDAALIGKFVSKFIHEVGIARERPLASFSPFLHSLDDPGREARLLRRSPAFRGPIGFCSNSVVALFEIIRKIWVRSANLQSVIVFLAQPPSRCNHRRRTRNQVVSTESTATSDRARHHEMLARCSACRSNWSSVFTGTQRVVGCGAASAIAYASRKSFL
jgi:hypothetical protein